ncbi:hypothetical protein AC579_6603 [Pseudocercospora musae]|uniref:Translation machinery-associated protein 20 n=1 Tax=Pseudocercospora musae TaxID=113226 RepID=A0A139IGB8_9PEZI|nr:hypothetical protein AC579_6603 [Pseudocercospora musae]
MFKKEFSPGAKSKVKSSVQRKIRENIIETYPLIEPYMEAILPKKEQVDLVKLPDRVSLYSLGDKPLFWQHMDDPIIPHLRVIHQYPQCFQHVRIDRGGIRFVLSGATLMTPGLTSPGGRLPGGPESEQWANGGKEIEAGEVVVVDAEGKENACMVGVLKQSTCEMKEKKKGPAIENGHYVGDGLWKLDL